MKVIVFGGSGFLGSHVADALVDAGHHVTVFDLLPSPYLRKGQRMVVGDILDEGAVVRVLKGQEVVFNFAGFSDIEAAQKNPVDTIRLNILGNGILLDACRRSKVRRYLFASTMYVYGNAASFYRASKVACEAYIDVYQRLHGLETTVLRFGSLYGPRADDRNGMFQYVRQALETNTIVYHGTGKEVREYIHVRDAAESCVEALRPKYTDACLILTGHQPMTIQDLFAMLNEMLGGRVKVRFRPKLGQNLAELHYRLTPYAYTPKEAQKLVRPHYVDLGQGILTAIEEMQKHNPGRGK